MTPERAREIVTAINARALMTHDMADKAESLAGVSLSDMIEAKQIIENGNRIAREQARAPGETYSMSVVPADRLIAAVYVFEHYHPDREPILCLPYRGLEGDRKILAVIALDAKDLVDGDEE